MAPYCKQVFPCRHCHNEATVSGCPAAACVGPICCQIEYRHLELHRGPIGVRRLLLAALVYLGAFTNLLPSAGIDPLAAPLPSAPAVPLPARCSLCPWALRNSPWAHLCRGPSRHR